MLPPLRFNDSLPLFVVRSRNPAVIVKNNVHGFSCLGVRPDDVFQLSAGSVIQQTAVTVVNGHNHVLSSSCRFNNAEIALWCIM